MRRTLRLALVQMDIAWQDSAANLKNLDRLLQALPETDLVVLPEMFTTGFSMASKQFAETMGGGSVKWMERTAKQKDSAICGSLMTQEAGEYFNRFVVAQPIAAMISYDKKHLFRMSTEHQNYSAGVKRITFPLRGFKICPQICYDLRFPAWTRNSRRLHSPEHDLPASDSLDDEFKLDYDLLLFVANWPAARRLHWLSLLRARAIENQCYVVGVYRIGSDGNGVDYAGDSVVIDYNGDTILDLKDRHEVGMITLGLDVLSDYRRVFPAWKDADRFEFVS